MTHGTGSQYIYPQNFNENIEMINRLSGIAVYHVSYLVDLSAWYYYNADNVHIHRILFINSYLNVHVWKVLFRP